MLLCLGVDGVNAHRLPSLSLKAQADRTAGASKFAWDDGTSTLAVIVRRRLIIFEYDGLEFVEHRDVALAPPSLSFMKEEERSLVIAGQCIYVTANNNDWQSIDSTGVLRPVHLPPVQSAANGAATGSVSAVVPGDMALLTNGCSVYLVGQHGKVIEDEDWKVEFSSLPKAICVSLPYVIGLTEEGIEIHPLGLPLTQKLTSQIVSVQGAGMFAPTVYEEDGITCLSVPKTGDIYRLIPLPYISQVQLLTSYGEYEAALALCRLKKRHMDGKERMRIEDNIQLELGKQLQLAGRVEESLLHLGSSSVATPLDLLRPFPTLSPSVLVERVDPGHAQHSMMPVHCDEASISTLLPYLMSQRSRLLTSGIEDDAMSALLDTAIFFALLQLPDTGALLQFLRKVPIWVDVCIAKDALMSKGRYSEWVAILQSKGDIDEALSVLKKLALGEASALGVSPAGAAAELQGLPGVWAAGRCLQDYIHKAAEADGLDRFKEILSNHADWILSVDPDAGLDLCIHISPPLSPKELLPLLEKHAPQVAAQFLEIALESGTASPEEYEFFLASVYLNLLLLGKGDHTMQQKLKTLILKSKHIDAQALLDKLPVEEEMYLDLRAALLERLGDHCTALRLLVHVLKQPKEAEKYADRVFERSKRSLQTEVVTQKSGRARKLKFENSPLAEAAASGMAVQHSYDIYLELVRVLLEDEDRENEERWGRICSLLSRKMDAIPPLRALELIPSYVGLKVAMPLIRSALTMSSEAQKTANILSSLRRSEHVTLLWELAEGEQNSVVMTAERACGLCYKRVGSSAFVARPSGAVLHLSCHRRMTTQ